MFDCANQFVTNFNLFCDMFMNIWIYIAICSYFLGQKDTNYFAMNPLDPFILPFTGSRFITWNIIKLTNNLSGFIFRALWAILLNVLTRLSLPRRRGEEKGVMLCFLGQKNLRRSQCYIVCIVLYMIFGIFKVAREVNVKLAFTVWFFYNLIILIK